jgi:hypothetical protein
MYLIGWSNKVGSSSVFLKWHNALTFTNKWDKGHITYGGTNVGLIYVYIGGYIFGYMFGHKILVVGGGLIRTKHLMWWVCQGLYITTGMNFQTNNVPHLVRDGKVSESSWGFHNWANTTLPIDLHYGCELSFLGLVFESKLSWWPLRAKVRKPPLFSIFLFVWFAHMAYYGYQVMFGIVISHCGCHS